jgi:hypothetical protein
MKTQVCMKMIEIATKSIKDKYDRGYIINYLEAEISKNKARLVVNNRNERRRYWKQKEKLIK